MCGSLRACATLEIPAPASMHAVCSPSIGNSQAINRVQGRSGLAAKHTCVAEAVQEYDGSCADPQHLIWVQGVRGAMQFVIRALAAWHARLCEWSMAVQLQSGQKRLPWSCCVEYLHVYISS